LRWQKKDKADFITDVGVKTLAFRDGMKPRPLQNSTSTSSVTLAPPMHRFPRQWLSDIRSPQRIHWFRRTRPQWQGLSVLILGDILALAAAWKGKKKEKGGGWGGIGQ